MDAFDFFFLREVGERKDAIQSFVRHFLKTRFYRLGIAVTLVTIFSEIAAVVAFKIYVASIFIQDFISALRRKIALRLLSIFLNQLDSLFLLFDRSFCAIVVLAIVYVRFILIRLYILST